MIGPWAKKKKKKKKKEKRKKKQLKKNINPNIQRYGGALGNHILHVHSVVYLFSLEFFLFLPYGFIKYESFLNGRILPVDTLAGITPSDQSEPNGNEGVIHTPHNSTTGASPSDLVLCDTQGFFLFLDREYSQRIPNPVNWAEYS